MMACTPFASSLNNSHCANMTRVKAAEASIAACRAYCCAMGTACNSYAWHAAANQCWVLPDALDPDGCHQVHGQPPQWVGETRHVQPPPPAPVSRKRGFSGFLGDDYTCQDADALGLSDSWSVKYTQLRFAH